MDSNRIISLQDEPITNFYPNIRSMFVATFTILIVYFLLLLIKFFVNALSTPASGAAASTQNSSRYQQWKQRGSNKQGGYWARMTQTSVGSGPPPPPAAATSVEAGQSGSSTQTSSSELISNEPQGRIASQGINSEIGSLNDSPFSESLSRAADVSRLGFLALLGGTALNALSFDPDASANVLAWLVFASFVFWAFLTMISRSRWIPLVMGFVTFTLTIAFFALGFEIASED